MFARLAQLSLILTLVLVLVGAAVRVTGAGLGCPDWPKCWGHWVPPADLDPAEARAHVEELIAKGELPAPYDPEAYRFDVKLMWIEYGNRMVGVTLGMVITALAFASLGQIRKAPMLTLASWAALIVVIIQGWLGAKVVASGLEQRMISIHLIGALIMVALLTWIAQSQRSRVGDGRGGADWSMPWRSRKALATIVGVMSVVTWGQILLGSWVREVLGAVKGMDSAHRREALLDVGILDHVHRSSSWLVLGVVIWALVRVRSHLVRAHPAKWWAMSCLVLVLIQIVFGVLLAYASLPPLAQLAHVGGASLLVTAQLWLWFGVLSSHDPSGYDPSR